MLIMDESVECKAVDFAIYLDGPPKMYGMKAMVARCLSNAPYSNQTFDTPFASHPSPSAAKTRSFASSEIQKLYIWVHGR